MSPIKEPHFFGAADLLAQPQVRATVERDRAALAAYLAGPQEPLHYRLVLEWDAYLRLFANSGDAPVVGESSTGYVYLPSAAGAIHARVPDARLAFVLRDPADRVFTRFLEKRWLDPRLTFRAWFESMLAAPRPWDEPFRAGKYATHLERFLALFGADRIRVYLYEDLRTDPRALLADLFAFLNVRPDVAIDVSRRHNPTPVPRFPLLHALRRRLFGARSPARWLPAGSRRALQRLYRRLPRSRTLDPADRRMVIDYFRDEIVRTAELIHRDLSAWLR